MKICYETVRNSEEIRTYSTQADQSLLARGFTEHSFAHVTRCAEFAARILAQLGYGEHDQELARIAGLFARRAFNINSLSVSPTERPDISRVTVTADVEAVPLEQIIKQLNKLLHVLKIVELDPNSTVERELV